MAHLMELHGLNHQAPWTSSSSFMNFSSTAMDAVMGLHERFIELHDAAIELDAFANSTASVLFAGSVEVVTGSAVQQTYLRNLQVTENAPLTSILPFHLHFSCYRRGQNRV